MYQLLDISCRDRYIPRITQEFYFNKTCHDVNGNNRYRVTQTHMYMFSNRPKMWILNL